MSAPRPRSLRHLLGLLALVLAMPMLALAITLGVLQVRADRLALEAAALRDVRGVLMAADGLVAARLADLRRIAREPALPAAMAEFAARRGLHLALIGAEGEALADTRPAEAALPESARRAVAAFATERLVSAVVLDPASGGHAVLVAVPRGPGWLTLAIPATAFQAILTRGDIGPFDMARFPAVVDPEGQLLARWSEAERFVGQPMPAAAFAALKAGPEGSWRGRSLDGSEVAVVHARSPITGLGAGVGITQAALTRPLWRSALTLGPVALLLLVLAGLATILMARRIGEPVATLGAAAAALAEGRPVPRLATPVAEVNAVAAAMADAAEKRQAVEVQRDLLVRELHHRVKNLLATAQSLATLSARSTRDPAGFAQQFGARLRALARTHTMLLEEPGGVVGLASLLGEVVAPYRTGMGRISLSGPPVRLPAEAAVPLGMVLHELTTNAAKYGSLSVPEGRLAVTWRLEDGPVLVVEWLERGGPAVAEPPREGFGSQLLRRALAGLPEGEVVPEWRPEGLAVRMRLGLRENQGELRSP